MIWFEIEFGFFLLLCLLAEVLFVHINYRFIRKKFGRRKDILISGIGYFFKMLGAAFMPVLDILISSSIPFSNWACNDAAIGGFVGIILVAPGFVLFNITLFIILIIRLLIRPLKTTPNEIAPEL